MSVARPVTLATVARINAAEQRLIDHNEPLHAALLDLYDEDADPTPLTGLLRQAILVLPMPHPNAVTLRTDEAGLCWVLAFSTLEAMNTWMTVDDPPPEDPAAALRDLLRHGDGGRNVDYWQLGGATVLDDICPAIASGSGGPIAGIAVNIASACPWFCPTAQILEFADTVRDTPPAAATTPED